MVLRMINYMMMTLDCIQVTEEGSVAAAATALLG